MDREKVIRHMTAELCVAMTCKMGFASVDINMLSDAITLLKGQDAEVTDGQKKVEFIESYIKIGDGDYEWSDNHGELIRCKDCVHWDKGHSKECENSDSICFHNGWCEPDFFCADGERKEGR